MSFQVKKTKQKVAARSKSIYITETLIEQIEAIAKENETSFNNVVISMIEHCLAESEEEKRKIENEEAEA